MIALVLAALVWAQAPSPADPAPTAPTASEGAPAPSEAPPSEAPPSDAPAADLTPAALGIDAADIVGAPAGPPLSGDALREKTHAIAKLMRCPVCQGLSVADSRTESAMAMKQEVEDLVAQGYDQEQVLLYFEASYGEFIRLEPKFEGFNVVVWAAPAILLALGAGFVALFVRRSRKAAAERSPPKVTLAKTPTSSPSPAPSERDPVDLDPSLAPYLRRVREETR